MTIEGKIFDYSSGHEEDFNTRDSSNGVVIQDLRRGVQLFVVSSDVLRQHTVEIRGRNGASMSGVLESTKTDSSGEHVQTLIKHAGGGIKEILFKGESVVMKAANYEIQAARTT